MGWERAFRRGKSAREKVKEQREVDLLWELQLQCLGIVAGE